MQHDSVNKIMVEENLEAWLEYIDYVGTSVATVDGFEEAYRGEYYSERDFAEDFFNDIYLHEIPEHLHDYIDYEAFAYAIFIGDFFMTKGGYVFMRF